MAETEATARVFICDCGAIVRGGSDEELASKTQAHLDMSHPERAGELSREDLLGMAGEE